MSFPCYKADGTFVAVVGMDMNVSDLNENIQNKSFTDNGYALLLNDDGDVISAPDLNEENRNSISDYFGEDLAATSTEILENAHGTIEVTVDSQEVYLSYSTVELTGWIYLVVLPKEDIIAPAVASANETTKLGKESAKSLSKNITLAIIFMILFIIFIIFISILVAYKITNSVVRPILTLSDRVQAIGNGNLDYTSDINTNDEIEDLSHSFENMTLELKEYIQNLSDITAEKERIGAELNVATQIQASMLPCIFPAFPDLPEVDLFATMKPAKEVGGDFYDFFKVDDNHICITIADVSGKGVPAALFMVIAKTLLKDNVLYEVSPAEVFNKVNNQLCENNEAGLFVTAFMGIYEISSGKFTYVNAGHNPPLLKKVSGEFEFMNIKPGFVLAGMEGMKYRQNEIVLDKGDVLYLYTDGVTEAINERGEFYGDPLLLETMNAFDSQDEFKAESLICFVQDSIVHFVGDAEPADDITMLAFLIKESQAEKRLTLKADDSELEQAMTFIETELGKLEVPPNVLQKVLISAEEIFVNIAHYAYENNINVPDLENKSGNERGSIEIILRNISNGIEITFVDSGIQYNPLEKSAPDLSLSADERELGGLGIFMTKKMMDDIKYEYRDNQNILILYKQL
jgi:sigma-B regulation protein RsbU (phosphoserine phosphatase)